MPSPIALFCFRRPAHLERTLTALAANELAKESAVFAFADGPRDGRDAEGVAQVGEVLRKWADSTAFASFAIIERKINFGLAHSLTAGISQVLEDSEQIIVVEDDILASPWFLRYCNDGLNFYRDDPEVASIHGYIYPVGKALPETFFIRGADCWGWATWRRAWKCYRHDADRMISELKQGGMIKAFNNDGARDLFTMLKGASTGKVESWAIKWHAATFLARMYTLYPGRTLVENIGLDASGTNCGIDVGMTGALTATPIEIGRIKIEENIDAAKEISRHLRQLRGGLANRFIVEIRRLLGIK